MQCGSLARDAQHAGDLAAERAKTEADSEKAEKAIAEFAALADRLTTLAAERAAMVASARREKWK